MIDDAAGGGTTALAGLVAGVRFDALGPEVVDAARRSIVDTTGVAVAGRGSEAGAAILDYAAGCGYAPRGEDAPIGLPRTAPAELAALVFGALGHALDYDDGLPGAAHASCPVLAAILGAAREAETGRATGPGPGPLTGAALVEAFVAGWEVVARVTGALGPAHYRRGWHTTSTAGTFGATAAAGRVLGLDTDLLRTAFGIAGSLAGGLRRNFGTMTKPLHGGIAASNGVRAARLAAAGLTADRDVLDGPGGVLDVYGDGRDRPGVLAARMPDWSWSSSTSSTRASASASAPAPALLRPGAILKAYPCCYASARAIDAVLQLKREWRADPISEHLDTGRIESVTCVGPVGAFTALPHHRPSTGLQGKFSLEYALAAALHDPAIGLETFADAAVRRPPLQALMAKVEVREEPRCRPEDPTGAASSPATGGFVEVTIRTTTGSSGTARVHDPHGSPAAPLTWPEIEAKFADCLRGTPRAAAANLFARLCTIERQPDALAALSLDLETAR